MPAPAGTGWQGAGQRAADNPGRMNLMGVRVYNPLTGRFGSPDSVYGGNANAYDYCAGAPRECSDLSGRYSVVRHHGKHWWSPVDFTMSLDLTYRLAYLFNIWGDAVNVVVAAFGALVCSAGSPVAMVVCGLIFGLAASYVSSKTKAAASQRGCVAINNWGYMWTDRSQYCHRT